MVVVVLDSFKYLLFLSILQSLPTNIFIMAIALIILIMVDDTYAIVSMFDLSVKINCE